MELRKLMQAAFIAGFAGVVLVGACLLWSPDLTWVGVLGSLAIGFLVYEFGEVLQAVPVAFEQTGKAVREIAEGCVRVKAEVIDFFRKPHPFIYDTVGLGVVLAILVLYFGPQMQNPEVNYVLRLISLFFILSFLLWFCSVAVFFGFAEAGHNVFHKEPEYQLFRHFTLKDSEYGCGQLALWTLVGFLYFLFHELPVGGWKLTRMVASYRRAMVMLSGLCGTVIALEGFAVMGPAAPNWFEYAMVPIMGGLISSAIVAGLYALTTRRAPTLGENSA